MSTDPEPHHDGPHRDVPALPQPPAPDRRRQLVAVAVTVVVLVVVFAGILPKFGNYAEAWDQITAMTSTQLAALCLAVVISILVYVLPFQAALPGLGFATAFMVRQTSFTISNAVPAGGAVGLGVQYGMLAQAGFGGPAATAAIGITSVFNLLVTMALPVLGVLGLVIVATPTSSQVLGAVGGLVAVGVMVAFFAAVLRSDATALRLGAVIDRVVARALGLLHRDPPASISDQLVSFRRSTVEVISRRWAALSATSFAQQFTQFGVLMVALRVTEAGDTTQVGVVAAFSAFALARLASFVPVTPGGLGTVDAALTGLLVAFGASRSDALAAALLWRAASWVPQVLLGALTLVIWRIRHHGVPVRSPRTSAT